MIRLTVSIIFIAILVLVITRIQLVRYRDKEKVDKGFVWNYYRLTYRRKMIRTLWGLPFMILFFLLIYWFVSLNPGELKFVGMILVFYFLLELTYNYEKWKENER
ncbi:hypothetical protein [Virgibacillus doumboii]|uniref:hypothetical protein n=1 Tax=Virgibacillus doumboii TaxID=2697503 RepID=UPI0013E0CB74|nr:hypothetical protein [Virgibacillus doumboii]